MSQIPSPAATPWYRPSPLHDIVTILGFGAWWSHWDTLLGQSRRCARGNCSLCEDKVPSQVRYVLLIQREADTQQYFIELRGRHFSMLRDIEFEHGQVEGANLEIWRSAPGKTAAVDFRLMSYNYREPVDISHFCASLGLSPIRSK